MTPYKTTPSPKQKPAAVPNRLTPDLHGFVIEYVRSNGKISGCSEMLPAEVGRNELLNRLDPNHADYDESLSESVAAAKADYDIAHFYPAKDIKLKRGVKKALELMVESGQSTVTTDRDASGKVTRTREVVKAGIPAWVYLAVYPPDEMSLDSLKAIVASQTAYLVKHYTDRVNQDEYNTIVNFIRSFLFDRIEDLSHTGADLGRMARYQRGEENDAPEEGEDIQVDMSKSTYVRPTGLYGENDA